jgi:hypothetical protein
MVALIKLLFSQIYTPLNVYNLQLSRTTSILEEDGNYLLEEDDNYLLEE